MREHMDSLLDRSLLQLAKPIIFARMLSLDPHARLAGARSLAPCVCYRKDPSTMIEHEKSCYLWAYQIVTDPRAAPRGLDRSDLNERGPHQCDPKPMRTNAETQRPVSTALTGHPESQYWMSTQNATPAGFC
jgi:hypothetical protein